MSFLDNLLAPTHDDIQTQPPRQESIPAWRQVATSHHLAVLAFVTSCLKSLPLSYVFFYYVPSPALLAPLALQTLAVSVGTASGTMLTSKWSVVLWSTFATFDVIGTFIFYQIIYPFGNKLYGEPDGTTNIYMSWIASCFVAYLVLGLLSFLCSAAGVVIWCLARSRRYSENMNMDIIDVVSTTMSMTTKKSYFVLLALSIFCSLLLLTLGFIDVATALSKTPPSSALPGGYNDPIACDPLVEFSCSLPFPSTFWTRKVVRKDFDTDTNSDTNTNTNSDTDEEASVTGLRLDLKGSIPATRWSSTSSLENAMEKRSFFRHDGFSTVAPVLFGFDREIDERTLSGPSNISKTISIQGKSTTWLIEKTTGIFVPHFVDKDWFDPDFGLSSSNPSTRNDQRRLLVLQPGHALKFNTTYVVAVTSGLRHHDDGSLVPLPTQGLFASLRDANMTDPSYNAERAQNMNENVWPTLAAVNIKRSTLLLAFR